MRGWPSNVDSSTIAEILSACSRSPLSSANLAAFALSWLATGSIEIFACLSASETLFIGAFCTVSICLSWGLGEPFGFVLSQADSSSNKLYMTGAILEIDADSGKAGELGLTLSAGVLIWIYFNTSCSF